MNVSMGGVDAGPIVAYAPPTRPNGGTTPFAFYPPNPPGQTLLTTYHRRNGGS